MNTKLVSALSLALALAMPLTAMAQGGPATPPPQDQQQPGGSGGHQGQGQQGKPQQGSSHQGQASQGQHRDDQKHGGEYQGQSQQGSHRHVDVDQGRRQKADDWFRGHPGWSKPLPSDVRGRVVVGKPLPPGHYGRAPTVIVDMLPPPPRGHAYFAVGTDVVLAVIATGIIAQIVLSAP